VKVKPSPKHSVRGRYQGQLDHEGLRLSRKNEVIDIPVGNSAAYQSGPSLVVEHEGADVKLTIAKPGWYCERLARDLADFLSGDGPLPRARDYRLPWYFWALALVPAGIPILALGGAIWGALGFGLVGLCLAIATRERWPAPVRAAAMVLASGAGYGILLAVLFFLHIALPAMSGFLPGNAPVAANPAAGAPVPALNPAPPRIVDYAGERYAIDTGGIPAWVDFSPDSQTLAVGDNKLGLSTYDAATGAPRGKAQRLESGLRYANFSPDGRRLVAGGYSGGPVVLDLNADGIASRCEAGTSEVQDAAFTGDGQTVLGAAGKSLLVWDAGTGKRLRELGPSRAQLRYVHVSREGKIITGGHDTGSGGRLDQVWSLEKGSAVADLPTFTTPWHVPNGKGGWDKVRKPVGFRYDERRNAFTVSPDGRVAVLVTMVEVVLPLDLVAGKQLPDLTCRPEAWQGAFTPDGSVLAIGKRNGGIDFFEMPGCEQIGSLGPGQTVGRMVFSLAFAPDGRHLAIGTASGFSEQQKVYVVDLGMAMAGWRLRPAAAAPR
jgi:WD40 repeat protein